MDIVTIGIVLLLAFLLLRLFVTVEVVPIKEKTNECPPHDWVYVKQPGVDIEYLQCKKCGAFPGKDIGEKV